MSGARQAIPITVMLGGPSAEREVSLRSGEAVAKALRGRGYAVRELDPIDPGWELPPGTGVVFLALHGTYGEDGTVQRRLEQMGVPYTGCDSTASRRAFDKLETKRLCEAVGLLTPPGVVVVGADAKWPAGWEAPLILKPVRQGSSVGLTVVRRREDWATAVLHALRHDSEALAEQFVEGRELTVGILAGEALPIVEVRPRSGLYDYHHKYTAGATEYTCPADLGEDEGGRARAAAVLAFSAVGGRDYGRVDMILDAAGRCWVLEVNTLPGMTETSLLPKAAAAAGLEFGSLCERMIELAWDRTDRR